MPELLPLPSRSASVSDLLEAANRLFRATLPKCLPYFLIGLLCAQLANFFWLASGHPLDPKNPPHDPTYLILYLAGVVANCLLVSAAMFRQRALARGQRAHTAAELTEALRRLPTLLLTLLLAMASMAVGFTLLLLPGIFLFVCYVVLWPAVLFDGDGPYRALVRSVELVRPFWWKTFLATIIAALVIGICIFGALIVVGILRLVSNDSALFRAIAVTAALTLFAATSAFLSAFWIVFHSAASSSA